MGKKEKETKSYNESDIESAVRFKRPIHEDRIGQFKERLWTAMKKRSVRGFAVECGISEGTLRSYLRGDTVPDLHTLDNLARGAGVSIEWLATGYQPRVSPLDSGVMRDVIEIVEEFLRERGLVLEPAKKAELLVLLYEDVREHEGKVDRARVIRLVNLAA